MVTPKARAKHEPLVQRTGHCPLPAVIISDQNIQLHKTKAGESNWGTGDHIFIYLSRATVEPLLVIRLVNIPPPPREIISMVICHPVNSFVVTRSLWLI